MKKKMSNSNWLLQQTKELRAMLIGTLDAGRQNFVFSNSVRPQIAAPLSVDKTTRDAGGASTRACVSWISTLSTTLRHKHKFREILILALY